MWGKCTAIKSEIRIQRVGGHQRCRVFLDREVMTAGGVHVPYFVSRREKFVKIIFISCFIETVWILYYFVDQVNHYRWTLCAKTTAGRATND